MKHDQYAKLTWDDGSSVYVNCEYIVMYLYNEHTDRTEVEMLNHQKVTFPGNQERKIENAINSIGLE